MQKIKSIQTGNKKEQDDAIQLLKEAVSRFKKNKNTHSENAILMAIGTVATSMLSNPSGQKARDYNNQITDLIYKAIQEKDSEEFKNACVQVLQQHSDRALEKNENAKSQELCKVIDVIQNTGRSSIELMDDKERSKAIRKNVFYLLTSITEDLLIGNDKCPDAEILAVMKHSFSHVVGDCQTFEMREYNNHVAELSYEIIQLRASQNLKTGCVKTIYAEIDKSLKDKDAEKSDELQRIAQFMGHGDWLSPKSRTIEDAREMAKKLINDKKCELSENEAFDAIHRIVKAMPLDQFSDKYSKRNREKNKEVMDTNKKMLSCVAWEAGRRGSEDLKMNTMNLLLDGMNDCLGSGRKKLAYTIYYYCLKLKNYKSPTELRAQTGGRMSEYMQNVTRGNDQLIGNLFSNFAEQVVIKKDQEEQEIESMIDENLGNHIRSLAYGT